MPKEHHKPLNKPAAEQFGLTENERLFYRVSHARLMQLLDDPKTRVHRIEESSNSFGEYLFVTLSRPGSAKRVSMTFYGLGYHEYRERWIADEWFWYEPNDTPGVVRPVLDREAAWQHIEQRYQEVRSYAQNEAQSRRGQLFEMLADLTDEDGAWAEMQDLPGWLLDDEGDEGLR